MCSEILQQICLSLQLYSMTHARAYLRGGSGNSNPPPKFSDFFLKSEGKEIERKRKKEIIFGVDIFSSGVEIFSGGIEKFSGGVEKFSWGVGKFSGGFEKFSGGFEKFSGGGGLRNFWGG